MQQLSSAARDLKPERRDLTADLVAGLTFAVVNVPQAMAHALLATVNPVLGIYTLMVAMPIGALFTSSVYMNVSTTSALSVAAASGLATVPEDRKIQALAAMVVMMGIIQLLAGVFKLGFLLRFVSNAVMTGFLNGVAVLIILSQLGDLTGYDSVYRNRVAQSLDLVLNLHQINVQATIIGLVTLGLMALLLISSLRRYAFIIAIVAATVLLALLTRVSIAFVGVETVGDVASIPRSLPSFALPSLNLILTMIIPAFSVAVIGLIQGAGVSQGYPNPNGKYPNVSRDFLGQGAANIASGLFGGLPAGGSISGTALIMGAGAKSRWTNILGGLFVAVIVLVAAPLVELVPMPALAALLIVAGVQGLRIPQAQMIWQTGRVPSTVMILTFVATLVVPLQYAVLAGVGFAILLYVFQESNKVIFTEIVPVPGGLPEEQPVPTTLESNRLTMLMVYGSVFFAGAKNLEDMLPDVGDARRAVVAIGLRGKSEIGSTFITVLQRYAHALQANGNRLMLVGVDTAVREQLARTGLLQIIGEENIFLAEPQLGAAMNRAASAAYQWLGQTPDGPVVGGPVVGGPVVGGPVVGGPVVGGPES